MMKKALGLIIVLIIGIVAVKAQFSISADISPRAELRHGYKILPLENEKPAAHVSQRTRLNLTFKRENIRTHIAFQDVRIWGQEPQKQNHPSLSIHQAWAELLFSDSLSLKIGRQELSYDNQRFFAINDWNQNAQKHDMALLKYNSPVGEIHLGTAFNQPPDAFQQNFYTYYNINNYKYMNFVWFNTALNSNASLSLLGIADGYENQENPQLLYVRATWSAYFTWQLNKFNLMVNPGFQHGKTAGGQDISAFYFRTEAATTLVNNVNSTLGLEILSGNDPEDNSTYRAFNPTHGAGHSESGLMDYFLNYPAHTRGAGLVNPYLKNKIKLSDNTTLGADLHLFFIQNDFVYQGEEINKYLGTEIDLTLNYRFNDFTRIIGGFSTMFGSESMEIINRGGTLGSKDEPAYFAYIMLRIRPKFL